MKISSLTLHNFGIYANTNSLMLDSDKPVVLIGGMNGRGKTTFLEAILLALYGRRSFAFIESKLSFPNYLTRLVNKSDGTLNTYIELIFDLPSGEETDHYKIKREWSVNNSAPILKTIVFKNKAFDQILSDNWDLFVEEMLPNAIAPFFFFDGEKISEIANSDNDDHMKSSIKTLLGIDVIEQSMVDIRKIITNKKQTIKNDKYLVIISSLDRKMNEIQAEAKAAADALAILNVKQIRLSNKLKKTEDSFSAMGGNLANSRKELLANQAMLQVQLNNINSEIIDISAGNLPLLLTMPLLQKILLSAESEREQKSIKAALEQLPTLYERFNKVNQKSVELNDFIKFIENNASEISIAYNLTENGFLNLKNLCTTLLSREHEDAIQLLKQRQAILSDIAKIENYLSINVDESIARSKYHDILELTKELATITEQHRLAQEVVYSKRATIENLSREKIGIIEKAVECLEGENDVKRLITYAGYTLRVFEEYKVRLLESKTQDLSETMTSCFRQISSKQNLIGKIQIDPETLDFIYLDSTGQQINRSSFSAGEKQLLVIAMLWALGICSKKRFPVIIDTPLARLDSAHRETLITNYFPKASDQTILLSTDSEVHGKYYELISPYVGKEYTLIYNDDTKQSTVHSGYFGGKAI